MGLVTRLTAKVALILQNQAMGASALYSTVAADSLFLRRRSFDGSREGAMASEKFLEQFSKTLSAAEHHSTRQNTASARRLRKRCQTPWLTLFVQWEGHVPLLQLLYDGPYAVLCRSLHHFTLRIGNKEDKVSTHRLNPCTDPTVPPAKPRTRGRQAPSPLPSAFGILPHLAFLQLAGYISPRHMQGNCAGNRFPLASRQGF
jgi:hypothetical protein